MSYNKHGNHLFGIHHLLSNQPHSEAPDIISIYILLVGTTFT